MHRTSLWQGQRHCVQGLYEQGVSNNRCFIKESKPAILHLSILEDTFYGISFNISAQIQDQKTLKYSLLTSLLVWTVLSIQAFAQVS